MVFCVHISAKYFQIICEALPMLMLKFTGNLKKKHTKVLPVKKIHLINSILIECLENGKIGQITATLIQDCKINQIDIDQELSAVHI